MSINVGFGKYVWIIGVVALFGSGGLFAYLETLGLEIECEDKICKAGTECIIGCNISNPTAQSVYLFNHDNFKLALDNTDIYVKYYGKWRYTNFTRETRFGNIPDERLYVFVFSRYSTKEFQLRTKELPTERINVQDNLLIEWSVPIGTRNFEEYGRCRKFEKFKNVCQETNLLEVVLIK